MSNLINAGIRPSCKQIEIASTSLVLTNKEFLGELLTSNITPFHFHDKNCREIFSCVQKLYSSGMDINFDTVYNFLLKSKSSITSEMLLNLIRYKTIASNYNSYISELKEYFGRRKVIELAEYSSAIASKSEDYMSSLSSIVNMLNNINVEDNERKIRFDSEESFDSIIDYIDNSTSSVILTEFKTFNTQISLSAGMHVIAGRPGSGKTVIADQIAEYVSKTSNVLFFSAEMNVEMIMARKIQRLTSIPVSKIINKQLNSSEKKIILSLKDSITKSNLVYIDKTSIDVDVLCQMSKAAHSKNKLSLIVIDYLQLLTATSKKTKYEEISYISARIRDLSKDLKIPIICLAQMNRSVESSEARKPQMSDLRETGQIEQDATSIVFIHREKTSKSKSIARFDDSIELWIRKNRNGSSDIFFKLKFDCLYTKFEELTKYDEQSIAIPYFEGDLESLTNPYEKNLALAQLRNGNR